MFGILVSPMKLARIIGVSAYLPTHLPGTLLRQETKLAGRQAGRLAGTPSKLTGWLDTQFGWAAAEYTCLSVCSAIESLLQVVGLFS